MDPTKSFVVEWVLTNGKTPGFTIEGVTWSVVDEPMTVYRGQGTSKSGLRMRNSPDPHTLTADLRDVISTSTDEEAAKQYVGTDQCCLFTITLEKGVQYLDVQKTVEGIQDADVSAIIETLRGRIPLTKSGKPNMCFALNKCDPENLVKTFRDRVAAEHEIMVRGGGVFSEVIDFKTTYSIKTGGRRRTLRSRRKRRTYRRRV
jgi:hypothetical protein